MAEAKDAEIGVLRDALDAARERERRLELRLAELERRLSMDSTDSGTPSSKERIGAREARRARQQSERVRSKDRKRGGQPGHQGKGLKRDPDPGEAETAEPPAQCRACRASLDGADAVEPRWAQVVDVEILRKVTEFLLPGLACPCCGTVTFAGPPPGLHAGAVCYGPVLNAAAVLLSCYGNVPAQRSAQLIGMLLGTDVSAGWVDKAVARVSAQLGKSGFGEAMTAALAAEDVLAADETPVNVLDRTPQPAPEPDGKDEKDPEEKDARAAAGSPHVLIVRTPDGRLTFLQAIGSRRKGSVGGGIPAAFTGHLITDGYAGYQHLLSRIAGIQQCAQHVIRRCRAVMKLGPGGVQNWAGDILAVLGQAHRAVEDARARGSTELDPPVLDPPARTLRPGRRVRADPQPAPGLARGEPPRLRTGLLAARLQGTGLPVHPELRRELDKQCLRARREGREAASGRVRLLAFPAHPSPLVHRPELPRLSRRPPRHRTRRHPQRHRGKALATATPRTRLTPAHGTP